MHAYLLVVKIVNGIVLVKFAKSLLLQQIQHVVTQQMLTRNKYVRKYQQLGRVAIF